MALTRVFCDSYDHYNLAFMGTKWDVVGPSVSIDSTGTKSRTGTGCCIITTGFGCTKVIASGDRYIMASAFHPNASIPFGTFFNIMWLIDAVGGNSQIRLVYQPDLSIQVRKANDPFSIVLGTSAAGLLNPNGWNYLSVRAYINAAGSVRVRLNGAIIIDVDPVNTVAAGTTPVVNQFSTYGGGGLSNSRHDDTSLWTWTDPADDLTTTASIYCAMADSDAAPLDFVPSVGLTHFNLVNSIPPDTTKYVQSATPGDIDQYGYAVSAPENNPPIPPYYNVIGVQHCLLAETDIAGPRSLASDIAGVPGVGVALGTPWRYYLTQYDINPATGLPWQQSEIPTPTKAGPTVTA